MKGDKLRFGGSYVEQTETGVEQFNFYYNVDIITDLNLTKKDVGEIIDEISF